MGCDLWPLTDRGGRGDFPHSQMGNWRMLTERPLYPAVVVDETQPLHCHISYMTPTEQDFAWRGGEGGTKSKCAGGERVKGNRVTMMEGRKRQRREVQIWHTHTVLPKDTTIWSRFCSAHYFVQYPCQPAGVRPNSLHVCTASCFRSVKWVSSAWSAPVGVVF